MFEDVDVAAAAEEECGLAIDSHIPNPAKIDKPTMAKRGKMFRRLVLLIVVVPRCFRPEVTVLQWAIQPTYHHILKEM